MVFFWAILLVVLVIAEAITVQLTSIWFAVGALGALFAAMLGIESELLQAGIFVIVSVVSLIVTRPLVKKYSKPKIQPTNADRYIGAEGIVTEPIQNHAGKGFVNVRGSIWTARSADSSEIEEGESIIVEKIEGVKLIVKRK